MLSCAFMAEIGRPKLRYWCLLAGSCVTVSLNFFNSLTTVVTCFNFDIVAGQNATIRFGRGRRPRGPTFARGTIRSLFENQQLARQRTAFDVATRRPCRNLFRDAHFEIIQFCLCRQSSQFLVNRFRVHFLFIGSLSVSLSVFVCFFRGFHFRVLLCRVFMPANFGAAGITHVSP
jgi:hypothetical protein